MARMNDQQATPSQPPQRRFRVGQRRTLRASLVALFLLAAVASAQTPPSLQSVRIGLPLDQTASLSRNGVWTPVAVTLRGGQEGSPAGAYRLRIETTDVEQISYQTSVNLPELPPDRLVTVLGYIVPGGDGVSFHVHLERAADGRILDSLNRITREANRDTVVGLQDMVYLAVGGGQSPLRRFLDRLDRPDEKEAIANLERGKRHLAVIEQIDQLPDRWIGYEGVDVVVLTTSKQEVVQQLAAPEQATRREALLEWLRRGGRMILSVGRNYQQVAELLRRWPVLDCGITGSQTVRALPTLSQWSERPGHKPHLLQAEVATLVPGPGVDVLIREGDRPLMVQAALGLGRVLLVAFDLDAPPFTAWEGLEDFWTRLQAEIAGSIVPRRSRKAEGTSLSRAFEADAQYALQTNLQRGLESFAEVTPVSFGWVALFLLVYMALVGPIDYFVLKRLFKRLEWTWMTFPLTVIGVSVLAYLTAYSLKGEQLRINKVDLVDVDMHEAKPQTYGTSWFTLFSPRVASYTLGVEPAAVWARPAPADTPGPVVTVLEAGERTLRAGSQSLFRRPYQYADEQTGLRQVPIPVWATRSFTANWRAPLAEVPPLDFRDELGFLRRARDGNGLVGRLTNNLQTPLLDVSLFYRDRWWTIGRLEPGEQRRIESVFVPDAQGQNREISQWMHSSSSLAPGTPVAPSGRPINVHQAAQSAYALIKPILFYRLAESPSSNAGLRRLDASWRLRALPEAPLPDRPRYRNEAIVVARTLLLADQGQLLADHPATATQLWLGSLPDSGTSRPVLPGIVCQETYLRIFFPIR